MSLPRFSHSENNNTIQAASESRDDRLGDNSSRVYHTPAHSTATLHPQEAATNGHSRIPPEEPSQNETYGRYLPNTNLESSGVLRDYLSPDDAVDTRRASDSSERTLYDRTEEEMQRSLKRVSLSSYQHPNDIASPPDAYIGVPPSSGVKRRFGNRTSPADTDYRSSSSYEDNSSSNDLTRLLPRHPGVVSNLLELSRISNPTPNLDNYGFAASRTGSLSEPPGRDMRPRLSRLYSLGGYDADDPRITGATRELLDDPADLERNVKEQMGLRSMNYKQRRKEAQKIKIRFFVTCTSRLSFSRCRKLTIDYMKPSLIASSL
jgi:hypothetical protein